MLTVAVSPGRLRAMSKATTSTAHHDDIEIAYETFGDPAHPALLLISGLGSQMVNYEAEFCEGFVSRGLFVIRFDNRDTGLSTKMSGDVDVMETFMSAMAGDHIEVPYLLSDMAADAVCVLDALSIERAHLFGISMGGMIAQTVAIEHPERVASLTSVMSTTGDPDVGAPDPELLPVLLEPPAPGREAAVEHEIELSRLLAGPGLFDVERARAKAERAYDRCFYPQGVPRQLVAILASGSRADALRRLEVDALVIHGDTDRLVDVSGGERSAECLMGSELLIIDGMGHDLDPVFWERITGAVMGLVSSAGPTG